MGKTVFNRKVYSFTILTIFLFIPNYSILTHLSLEQSFYSLTIYIFPNLRFLVWITILLALTVSNWKALKYFFWIKLYTTHQAVIHNTFSTLTSINLKFYFTNSQYNRSIYTIDQFCNLRCNNYLKSSIKILYQNNC